MSTVNEIIDKVRKETERPSLVFPIFTDLHIDTAENSKYVSLKNSLAQICSELNPDAVISLGDNLTMLGRMFQTPTDEIFRRITAVFDGIEEVSRCPLYAVNGNHDGIGTDFFDSELWCSAVNGRYDKGNAVYNGSSAYYYADYKEFNTRLVFLSLPCGSDLEAEYPSPLWHYGAEQLKWLAGTALNTPDDYGVIIMCHVPLWYKTSYGPDAQKLKVWDGERVRESHIGALCGWIDDRDAAEAVLNAYNNHEKVEIDSICADFSRFKNTRLIACVSGHMHEPSFMNAGETVICSDDSDGNAQKQNELKKFIANRLACPQIVIKSTAVAVYTPSEHNFRYFEFN